MCLKTKGKSGSRSRAHPVTQKRDAYIEMLNSIQEGNVLRRFESDIF